MTTAPLRNRVDGRSSQDRPPSCNTRLLFAVQARWTATIVGVESLPWSGLGSDGARQLSFKKMTRCLRTPVAFRLSFWVGVEPGQGPAG